MLALILYLILLQQLAVGTQMVGLHEPVEVRAVQAVVVLLAMKVA
jgi:hypothetical protein